MDELLKQVMNGMDLDEGGARKVIKIVLGFLKDKFPKPVADQLQNLLDGREIGDLDLGALAGKQTGGLGGLLSGLFGGGKKK